MRIAGNSSGFSGLTSNLKVGLGRKEEARKERIERKKKGKTSKIATQFKLQTNPAKVLQL